ncbi:MAG: hypothetical protein ABI231_12340 [Candidatus Tumulicola sp.]
MPDRSFPEPNEYVIWGASGLLALVLGLGTAFVLWVALHRSDYAGLATGAVVSLGLGLLLIGLAAERPLTRIFFVLLAAMLAIGYAVGGPGFARLVP